MSAPIDFAEQQNEVAQIRSWLSVQDEDTQMAAVLEVARLRIIDAARPLFSLRFTHAESTCNAILSSLCAPSASSALKVFGVDPERFADAVKYEVRRLGTTRPNDWWRKNGVGRPKRETK